MERVSLYIYSPETQQQLDQLTQIFIGKGSDPTTADNQAIAQISKIIRREAYVMAYNDGFYFVGIALLPSGLALLFCKKVKPGAGAAAH